MKVCMLVINSVSHDARVLKEAEAVRETGADVVIVGIQDASNKVPIQVLDNGVVIRRAAWQAEAFRPWLAEFIGRMLAAVLALVVVLLVGAYALNTVAPSLGRFWDWLSLERVAHLLIAGAAVGGLSFVAFRLWREYARRRKSHLNLKKREEDELLKYDAVFAAYRAPAAVDSQWPTAAASELAPDYDATPSRPPRVAGRRRFRKRRQAKGAPFQLPRPMMRGALALLDADEITRWKVIFARERCLRALLADEAPEILHAHDLTALPLAAKYASQVGATLVFDAHEIYDHLAQAEDDMAELNSQILNKYAGRVDRFVTINDSIASYYQRHYPALPPAVVVKNAAKLAEPVDYDGRLHEMAGLPRERKIVIYQGGYAPRRGLIQLLMSAEYLNPEWSLVYMGWGKLEDELLRVADALTLKNPAFADKVRFIPKVKQDELPLWTAGATIGAIPYENTGLNHWYCNPNKLWEYPNAGVPIIASPFPEMGAIIDTYELGWYLPDPLNPKLIADVINALSDEQLAMASANCRKFMAADNWENYAKRLNSLYGELK